jgi:cyclase
MDTQDLSARALSNIRLIARLDIKGSDLIKGIQMEGVRKLGDPREFACRYYEDGIDEILYIDAVASLYGRDKLLEIIKQTSENVFVPVTAGGGLRSKNDVREILRAGADKVAINTAATSNPSLITEIAEEFGSQCMVLSIQAKSKPGGGWEAYRDSGREHTRLDAVEWAIRGQELGAGEILLTSVDHEGMRGGFDIELTRAVSSAVDIPVIASGGMGKISHFTDVVMEGCADAVAMAYVLHYQKISLVELRAIAQQQSLPVRQII